MMNSALKKKAHEITVVYRPQISATSLLLCPAES